MPTQHDKSTDRSESPCSNGVRLVVGAGGGIGLALTEQQLADPEVRQVIATHRPGPLPQGLDELSRRHPERLTTFPLDVTCGDDLERLTAHLQAVDGGFDLAIQATGLLHNDDIFPERSVADCRADQLMELFAINSIAPLMVAQALLPVQARRRRFTFAALSAMVGSIGDNRLGGWYGYRASKTALNQFLKTLSIECRMKFPQAAILAVHPGTTDTGLSRPFQRSVKPDKLYTTDQTANRILQVVSEAGPEDSGSFFHWDGSRIPW